MQTVVCAAAAAAAAGPPPASLLRSIAQRVGSKQQPAVEVVKAYLQQLKSVEEQVGAFLAVNEEAALAQVGQQVARCARCACLPVFVLRCYSVAAVGNGQAAAIGIRLWQHHPQHTVRSPSPPYPTPPHRRRLGRASPGLGAPGQAGSCH